MLGSVTDIIIVGAVIALLFGAKKLPEFAKSLGRATGEFNKGKLEVQKEIDKIKEPVSATTNTLNDASNAMKRE